MTYESVESIRGCGYRKLGGMYLVSGMPGASCGRLPFPLHACPTCGGGIRQARGFTWIEPRKLFDAVYVPKCNQAFACGSCPMSGLEPGTPERAGLMWVGEKYYPTPAHFSGEAKLQGISKRISALPRGFELGETIVYMAHPRAIVPGPVGEDGRPIAYPGVFLTWRPERIELIVAVDGNHARPEDLRRKDELQEKYGDRFRAVHVHTEQISLPVDDFYA